MNKHIKYMQEALKYADKAYKEGEVPIGAVVVYDNQIIGFGYNKRQQSNYVHAHAEIEALNSASLMMGTWNLSGCTLYVSVEPCPMCAGAIIQSHVDNVVFGAYEPNSGSFGSVVSLNQIDGFNHKVNVIGGVLEEECSKLMKSFFLKLRESKIKVKRVDENIFRECLKVRVKVFVDEQGVSIDEEIDEYDDLNREDVVHIAALLNNKVIGTARYVSKNQEYKIGRVAVLKECRGLSVGSALLNYIEKQAENNGIKKMVLGAQVVALPFYQKLGYKEYGEVFDDAGIDHLMMAKDIKKTT